MRDHKGLCLSNHSHSFGVNLTSIALNHIFDVLALIERASQLENSQNWRKFQ